MGFLDWPRDLRSIFPGTSWRQYPDLRGSRASAATSILATYFLLPSSKLCRRATQHFDAAQVHRCWTGEIMSGDTFANRTSARGWRQFLAFALAFSMFMSGFPLFAERRFEWHGHAFRIRKKWATFTPTWACWASSCKAALIGRVSQKHSGKQALVARRIFLRLGGSDRARLHIFYSPAAGGYRCIVVRHGNGPPGFDQPDHAESRPLGTRSSAGANAVAQLDCRDHRSGGRWFPDRPFSVKRVGAASRRDLRCRAAFLALVRQRSDARQFDPGQKFQRRAAAGGNV